MFAKAFFPSDSTSSIVSSTNSDVPSNSISVSSNCFCCKMGVASRPMTAASDGGCGDLGAFMARLKDAHSRVKASIVFALLLRSRRSCCIDRCSFTLGELRTFFTLSLKRRVVKVSLKQDIAGEHAAIKHVFALPPNDCCKTRVNFESRYGTWCRARPLVRAAITFPRQLRLRLIVFASSKESPAEQVCETFSDPARSTKCSTPWRSQSVNLSKAVTLNIRMKCEREDTAFMRVAATRRPAWAA
mmetsp:Transcript_67502/g.106899  ORF Transcript_67502/g.106899 Transcript_67502/m.106899 type:complete len:244 (+) Transcript_67502:923-1654(+)